MKHKLSFCLPHLNIKRLGVTFSNIEGAFLISITLLMAIVVFWATLVRYLPIYGGILLLGTEEFGRLMLVWLWLLAGAAVHRKGGHFKLTLLVSRVPNKIQFLLKTVADIILLFFIVALTRNSAQLFMHHLGSTTLNLQWPAIVFSFPLLIGCPLIGVYTLINLAQRIKTGK